MVSESSDEIGVTPTPAEQLRREQMGVRRLRCSPGAGGFF